MASGSAQCPRLKIATEKHALISALAVVTRAETTNPILVFIQNYSLCELFAHSIMCSMKSTRLLPETLGYLLTKLGQDAFDRFSEKLAPHGLRPRHCGLLAVLDTLRSPSQQTVGEALGVVPSSVVVMIDDLEQLGAIARTPDPDDRRRFRLELTPQGKKLLRVATTLANDVDAELLSSLEASATDNLYELLGILVKAKQRPRN
jgi:DNA-binding MarR family transcriptional regulator